MGLELSVHNIDPIIYVEHFGTERESIDVENWKGRIDWMPK